MKASFTLSIDAFKGWSPFYTVSIDAFKGRSPFYTVLIDAFKGWSPFYAVSIDAFKGWRPYFCTMSWHPGLKLHYKNSLKSGWLFYHFTLYVVKWGGPPLMTTSMVHTVPCPIEYSTDILDLRYVSKNHNKELCFLKSFGFSPSLNTQSCIRGLLVVRDFFFLGRLGSRANTEKKGLSWLWATFLGGISCFGGQKNCLKIV